MFSFETSARSGGGSFADRGGGYKVFSIDDADGTIESSETCEEVEECNAGLVAESAKVSWVIT